MEDIVVRDVLIEVFFKYISPESNFDDSRYLNDIYFPPILPIFGIITIPL